MFCFYSSLAVRVSEVLGTPEDLMMGTLVEIREFSVLLMVSHLRLLEKPINGKRKRYAKWR